MASKVEQISGTGNGALLNAGIDAAVSEEPVIYRGVVPNPLIDHLKDRHKDRGVLIPLKTTQEVRQDHTVVQAWVTRAPTKCANDVIS